MQWKWRVQDGVTPVAEGKADTEADALEQARFEALSHLGSGRINIQVRKAGDDWEVPKEEFVVLNDRPVVHTASKPILWSEPFCPDEFITLPRMEME